MSNNWWKKSFILVETKRIKKYELLIRSISVGEICEVVEKR